jgi:phosphoribosylaminoimidazole-succinocarboxamide synthase
LLLIVATDRLSTHNVVHESPIPKKGEVLTALTVHWLAEVFPSANIRHHLIAFGSAIEDYIDGNLGDYPADLRLRGIVVEKLHVIPIEFIFRAHLGGSLFEKFYSKGLPNPYGIELPQGLSLMSELPDIAFTPTEKSETDDPLKAADVLERYPEACALARKAFVVGRHHLRSRGINLLDGKKEVGLSADGPVIIDEVLTPDSCRLSPSNAVVVGQEPPYADKQIARDEAIKMWGRGPRCPLTFSPSVINRLTSTYLGIFARITGSSLDMFQRSLLG